MHRCIKLANKIKVQYQKLNIKNKNYKTRE